MGYRSEIAIEMLKDDYEKLMSELKNVPCEYDPMNLASVYERRENGWQVVTIHWDWIKWYDNERIEYIKKFLTNVPCHVSGVGEELDDNIEEVFNEVLWPIDIDTVCVQRSITGWDKGVKIG